MGYPSDWLQQNYLNGQSGLASFSGPWIDCSRFGLVQINVWWSAFAATSGALTVDISGDYTFGAAPNPAAGSITQLTLNAPTGGNITGVHGTGLTVGATAGATFINIWPTPRLVRLTYTRSAGGTTGQFNATVTGKGI
jgi:hypothetical protein